MLRGTEMKRSGSLGEGERRRSSRRGGGVKKAENLITMKKRLSIIVFPLKIKTKSTFSPKCKFKKSAK